MPWLSFRLHAFINLCIWRREIAPLGAMDYCGWITYLTQQMLLRLARLSLLFSFSFSFFLSFFKNLINFSFQLICRLHSWEMVTEDGGLTYGN